MERNTMGLQFLGKEYTYGMGHTQQAWNVSHSDVVLRFFLFNFVSRMSFFVVFVASAFQEPKIWGLY